MNSNINLFPVYTDISAKDYLQGAIAAAEYIRGSAISGEKGVYWPDEKGEDPQIDFYNGSAGIILFFLQLARATGDSSYLKDARAGGDYILNELTKVNYNYTFKGNFTRHPIYKNAESTFYIGGFAGVAFSFIELSKATGDNVYEQAALVLTEKIAANAKPVESGVIWSGYSAINHDGGTILFLLYAANHFKRSEWRELAAKGGRAIMATGVAIDLDRVLYKGYQNPVINPDFPDTHYPNFAYGASGMCYALARLYEETRDRDFLDAAEKGANYLISIATPAKEGKLLIYQLPHLPGEDLYYLSFCNGPAGTGRLFVLLNRLTEKQVYEHFYLDLAHGIISAGAPEYHSAGYWNCHCQCCGTAGFLTYFLGVWLESGKEEYLNFAIRSGKVLLGSATYKEHRAVWHQAFARTNPAGITAALGYFKGAAGIGAALLQLATALDGNFDTIRLPDDPFATGAIANHR
ncbi:conserved hypothetical protein [Treponema primitia ZAS-2]|uniref:Lanthionine synthetase C family protein n=1 Tax=Treponema primitia (strain ATCC BAA-887 / DSM 12427 / ZAS-2) TaxID=545694 RepID=F5YK81_TREPZ|nr:lanthionine synthetase LanC family protein [Treponema primitia]AEF84471.1 conserved hypothetical protein [Treponema primitia ZAS-2]